MNAHRFPALAGLAFSLLLLPAATSAQQANPLVEDLINSLNQVEEKLTSLAKEFPEDKWNWRPAEGVRSPREVIQHVAADNWFLPTAAGVSAPANTGIQADDYPSVQAFEAREMSREEIMQQMASSFAHAKEAIRTSVGEFDKPISLFGFDTTIRGLWVMETTHVHEHLGQLIAYARSNGIVPPWSR